MKIEVAQVTKKYGEVLAVDNISFEINPGEIVGYLGPNGAGKSTTIKMLTGILAPTSGHIRIDGTEMSVNSLAIKQRIGYVPEVASLYESLTGFEFLQLVGRLYHLEEEAIVHRATEMFQLFDLEKVMHHRLSSYSKGMKQKVLICSALIHNPEAIYLDEPLGGLDATTALILKDLIRNLADRNKTIFYSSHVLDVVERLCTRVIIINRGKIVADSPVDKLKEFTAQKSLEGVFHSVTESEGMGDIADKLSAVITR